MRIDQLPIAASVVNTDTLPFNHSGTTLQVSVADMTNSIRDNVYGAPLTATSASAMTDTTKVYVYTGNTGGGYTYGHWYYYNGSAWTDGGVYNSAAVQTDTSLTLSGVAADAKATGDRIALNVRYDAAQSLTTAQQQQARTNIAATGSADVEDAIYAAMKSFGWPYSTVGIKNGDGTYALATTSFMTNASAPARFKEFVLFGKSTQDGTPSPTSPIAIVNAGGSGTIGIRTAGENMLPYPYEIGTTTINGVTFTVNANGTVDVSGTNALAENNVNFNLFRSSTSGFLPNGVYTVSGLPTDGTGLSACALQVRTNNKSGGNAQYYSVPASGQTFTCTDNATITSVFISVSPSVAVSGVRFSPMIVRGVAASDFTAYTGSFVALPTPNGLPGIPVSSGGIVAEFSGQQWLCDTIDMAAGTYTRRVGTAVCDGSEDEGWTLSSNLDYMYGFSSAFAHTIGLYDTATEVAAAAPHMTSWSTGRTIGTWQGNDVQVGESYISGAARLWIRTDISTIEAFKAALAANPMTFIFKLPAPITQPLTDLQKSALNSIILPNNVGTIYTTDTTNPLMYAEYYQSVEARLDALSNR